MNLDSVRILFYLDKWLIIFPSINNQINASDLSWQLLPQLKDQSFDRNTFSQILSKILVPNHRNWFRKGTPEINFKIPNSSWPQCRFRIKNMEKTTKWTLLYFSRGPSLSQFIYNLLHKEWLPSQTPLPIYMHNEPRDSSNKQHTNQLSN